MVQRNGMIAQEGKGLFREMVLADKEIMAHLSPAEVESCFDVAYYTKHVNTIFKRVFGK